MGKAAGFLEYERKTGAVRAPKERIQDFREFHESLPLEEQKLQGARCMDCGVPFCQFGGMLGGMASGCPLHNLVPEFNDLVYLSLIHIFPGRTRKMWPGPLISDWRRPWMSGCCWKSLAASWKKASLGRQRFR